MATKNFQQIVWQVIKDCPGDYNLHDDLQVVGADDKENEANLERVMTKLQDNGITLYYDKCEIGVPILCEVHPKLRDNIKFVVGLDLQSHKWCWGPREDKAFGDVKTRLTHAQVMAYHRQGAPIRLMTDASPVEIGAILEQEQEDGSYRPIYYASRKLSKVEK
ncbi:uncharacterized protein [Montipora capricornis]|uniref:uncharacterized protein n=1 Tax=Montipora capricornis TaxID=246305 RepID=UPI0035F1B2C5